ncbi:MAG: ATP-binding protein [Candidatus Gracilibacteria bacterium]|nr:ATP-binding protein [Candidatus Gracilibacteria bacterium]
MNLINIDEFPEDKSKKETLLNYIENQNLNIEFQYKSDFKNTKVLREFIETSFLIFNVKSIWKSRFILISDEINNNAIEYGSLDNEINKLTLNIEKIEDGISINLEVVDTGNGKASKKSVDMYDLEEKKLENGFDNHTGIRGRGLFQIIYKIVDELYFKDSENGGLIVGVKKNLKKNIDLN